MINKFENEFHFLSNYAYSYITFSGKSWRTSEHVYAAAKTLDENEREKIRLIGTPGEAKRYGRVLILRPDWEQVKLGIMLKILRLKFKQNLIINKKLLNTGDRELVEGNYWHDNFWGDCTCFKCIDKEGQNNLGKLLMQVREELKTLK